GGTFGRMRLLDGLSDCTLEQLTTNPDAAPSDAVQILPIDETSERCKSVWPIAIDIVEGTARVESAVPSQANPRAQSSERAQEETEEVVANCLRRQSSQWSRQASVFVEGVTALVCVEKRCRCRGSRECRLDEIARHTQRATGIQLVIDIMKRSRQPLEMLHPRSESIEELSLCVLLHHPVGARNQHKSRDLNRRGVLDEACRCVVQIDQDSG